MGPALGASYTRGAGRHIDPVRVLVWVLMGALVVCVVGFVLARWKHEQTAQTQTASSSTTFPLQVVFGDQAANGSQSVCTDETLQAGSWSCTTWATNTAGLPTEQAAAQDGSCTERRVDESAGRWVCVPG